MSKNVYLSDSKYLKACLLTSVFSAALFAQTPAFAQEDDQEIEEVVVTGIRRSLDNAFEIKRNADQMVDVITAEDIGLFSDNNIGEALQRIPGVLLEREAGEGFRISIRGLGPRFVRTTINGRTALSAAGGETGGGDDARGFTLNMIPSEVITKATVEKSTMAKNLEGGMAGVLDLTTNRPLDFANRREQDFFVSGSFRGRYNSLSKKFLPRESIFLNKKLSDNFGVFFAAVIDDADRQDNLAESQRLRTFDHDLVAGTLVNGTALPADLDDQALSLFSGVRTQWQRIERSRQTYTGGLQWQQGGLNVNVDWTHSRESETRDDLRFWTDTSGIRNSPRRFDTNSLDIVFEDEDLGRTVPTLGTIVSAELSGVTRRNEVDDLIKILNRRVPRTQRIHVGGINLEWTNDIWTIEADVGYAEQKTVRTFDRLQIVLNENDPRGAGGFGASFDITSGFPVVLLTADDGAGNVVPIDPLDASFLRFNQLQQNITPESGQDISVRFDLTREFDGGFIDAVFAGFAWNERQHSRTRFNKSSFDRNDVDPNGNTLNLDGIDIRTVDGVLPNQPGAVHSFAVPDIDAARFEFFFDDPDSFGGFEVNEGATFDVKETVSAGYVQAAFSGGANVPFRGNVGVRLVHTKQIANGLFDGSMEERITERTYTDFLPSFNVAFNVNENVVLRFAGNRAVTRPDPQDLSGFIDLDNVVGDELDGTGDGGNPFLEPYHTYSLDGALEWYPEAGGSYVLGLFYKKIDGWIASGTSTEFFNVQVEDPEDSGIFVARDVAFEIDRPVNTDGGDLKGFEFAFHTPLDSIAGGFLRYFGINGSLTYVDAKIDAVVPDSGVQIALRQTSKWSGNLIVYFEKGKFGTRLAYNFRSNFLFQEASANDRFDEFTKGSQILDWNMDYRINKNVRIRFSANNLTDVKRTRFWQTANSRYFSDQRDNGQSFTFEIRARY